MSSPKTKLVICSKDSIFTHDFLGTIHLCDTLEIVGTISSTRIKRKNENGLNSALSILTHCGLSYALFLLKVTTPGLLRGSSQHWKSLKQWAKSLQVQHRSTADINQPDMIKAIQDLAPDMVLSVHFNQIFDQTFIKTIGCPIINIHPGSLPDYRGLDPTFFAMLNKERSLGFTIHEVDEGIDTGQILAKGRIENQGQSLLQATRQCFQQAGISFVQYLTSQNEDIPPTDGQSRYYSWPTKQQISQFKKKYHLI